MRLPSRLMKAKVSMSSAIIIAILFQGIAAPSWAQESDDLDSVPASQSDGISNPPVESESAGNSNPQGGEPPASETQDKKPAEQGTQEERPPTPEPAKRREGKASDWILPTLVIGAAALILHRQLSDSRKVQEEPLLNNGPQFPDQYESGLFPVQGFIKGGWPMVIDYEVERASRVWVEVTADGKSYYNQVLTTENVGGRPGEERKRLLVTFQLPEKSLGKKLRPGLIVVRAVKESEGQTVKDAAGADAPAYLRVYGMGAGPKAVGSITIDNVVFQPEAIKVENDELAAYSYRVLHRFAKGEEAILRTTVTGATIRDDVVTSRALPASAEEKRIGNGDWDGRTDNGKGVSSGLHQLRVRAWDGKGPEQEGQWVAAMSDSFVSVSE